MTGALTNSNQRAEFGRQVHNLLRKGYPELSGLAEERFVGDLEPLGARLADLDTPADGSRIPFVIVVTSDLVTIDAAMPLVELEGKRGFTEMASDELKRFTPIDGVELPAGPAYLLADIDTGPGTLNVTPDDALVTINAEKRSPLTIDEGVALVTQYPEVLKTRNAFSMLGSRCGDRRVTAMWISKGSPRLGWCWAGNPHTWLGSASGGRRLGP